MESFWSTSNTKNNIKHNWLFALRWNPFGVPPIQKRTLNTINYWHRGGVLLEYLQCTFRLDMKWVMSRWSPFGVPPTSKINNIYIYFDYIGIEVESILEYFQHQIVKQKHNSDKNTRKNRLELNLYWHQSGVQSRSTFSTT